MTAINRWTRGCDSVFLKMLISLKLVLPRGRVNFSAVMRRGAPFGSR
jgi:hypothetical protein